VGKLESEYQGYRAIVPEGFPLTDFIILLCEGNPGAANVLGEIAATKNFGVITDAEPIFRQLVDMNIRGMQIWCAYKDLCASDLNEFVDKVMTRDATLVQQLNGIMYLPRKRGLPAVYRECAVEQGWKR
jgi:hypothetical protein